MQLNELNIVQKVQRCKSSDIETGAPKVLEMKAKNFRHSIPMSNATITLWKYAFALQNKDDSIDLHKNCISKILNEEII